jgi:hypothetical protein
MTADTSFEFMAKLKYLKMKKKIKIAFTKKLKHN